MAEAATGETWMLAGRYEVGDVIGRGGMADVHLGTDVRLGRRVAIKLLKPELAADPAFRSRFRREAQDAAKMAHPTIVRIFDAGEETTTDPETGVERQVPFIVMEYVEGRLLSELIASGPLDIHRAVQIESQLLTALEYSHRAGLVHRDIKPGNIMITGSGQVKVMDFGIARAISESSSTIAEASMIVGTAQYFSPEQARGEAVDARTDLYAAGVVLFEMLTGRAPFVGENPVAVAYQHVNQQASRPSTLNPQVSPQLDAVVMRAITKDRFERYQSASDFRADLEGADAGTIAGRRPSAATTAPDFTTTLFGVNPVARTASEATMRQLEVDDRTRGSRATQSRPPVIWLWAGIVVVIAIVVAVIYWTFSFATATPPNTTSVTMPDLVGVSYEQAASQLEAKNLKVERIDQADDQIDSGSVISTNPSSGITISPDTTITVYVSTGAAHVTVPLVTNFTLKAATDALKAAGLKVSKKVTTAHSPDVAEGLVSVSSPAGGADAQKGDTVTLTVSDGRIEIPSVSGQVIGDALSTLSGPDYQLDVSARVDQGCSGGTVESQSLVGVQPQNVAITLTYCGGTGSSSGTGTDTGDGTDSGDGDTGDDGNG